MYNGNMKRAIVWSTLLALGLFLFVLAPVTATAQGTGEYHYFAETGHYVQGDFWRYYQSLENAESVLGYPITEQLVRDGRMVQYFQNMVLEQWPGQAVRPVPIGAALLDEDMPQISIDNPACRTFTNNYRVCFAFLEFFDANGGEAVFGKPISNFIFDNTRIVQYFENARLEWQPWKPVSQRIGVSPLGLAYFDEQGESPALRLPVSPDALVRPITLDVRLFTWKPVTRPSDEQILFVIVRDQSFQPQPEVSGNITIHWPNGKSDTYLFQTDERGIARLKVQFQDLPAGSVVNVDAEVQSGGLNGSASTSFRIWH